MAPDAPVVIHPYNPEWPRLYEEERQVILRTLGRRVLSISHIGSTSVPGLPSKDIVDIIAGVTGREAAGECQRLLLPAGYDDVTPEEHPEWFYCLGKRLSGAYCHLHIVVEGSRHHLGHLAFRDWLRGHPEDARAYAELKISLAGKHRNERRAYTEAKNQFIQGILSKARGQ